MKSISKSWKNKTVYSKSASSTWKIIQPRPAAAAHGKIITARHRSQLLSVDLSPGILSLPSSYVYGCFLCFLGFRTEHLKTSIETSYSFSECFAVFVFDPLFAINQLPYARLPT